MAIPLFRLPAAGRPYAVGCKLTARCNLECGPCPFRDPGQKDLPAEAWKGIIGSFGKQGVRHIVFEGGEPTLRPDLAEIDVLPGVYVAASQQNLEQLAAQDEAGARFFVGYAGWGSGQLERELEEDAWLTAPATPEHVFGSHDDLWEQVTRDIKASVLISALKIKHVPKEPWFN